MEKQKEKKPEYIIDVDKVIEKYNTDNPEKRELTRLELAQQIGSNKQSFVNWKTGKTPKWVFYVLTICEIGGFRADKTPIDIDNVIERYNKNNPDKKISQADIAKQIGVDKQNVSVWKPTTKKTTPIWIHWVSKLCEIGNCNIDTFIIKNNSHE
jgi:hypothetical protein